MKHGPTYQLDVPRTYGSLSGSRGNNRNETVRVMAPTKPPRLRFKPGDLVKHEGQNHVVVYVYRVRDQPHEWFYMLEEAAPRPRSPSGVVIDSYLAALGAGERTKRVVYELFRDDEDAIRYFSDIPRGGNGSIVSNKTLLRENTECK
jgi:hypothetical protein